MWAGGRLAFHAPLRIGQRVQRRSVVEQVTTKQGRSGPLLFVTVRHALHVQGVDAPAVVEHHDIVYRGSPSTAGGAGASRADPAEAAGGDAAGAVAARAGVGASDDAAPPWLRTIVPDPVLLFRYSALTFNSHRIHYDRRWATEAEGYPGLVVHGPLIATLLLDLLHRHRPAAALRRFEFRALAPAFDGAALTLLAQPLGGGEAVNLWAQGPAGGVVMRARAELC
jgi:3-methylfumaryl-CoA hydratase